MRLELTRKTDLALSALRTLAASGRRMGATELAAAVSTTPTYLPQAMAPMVRLGWVNSQPGPTGGYEVSTNLSKVSVLAVIEAVEGPVDEGRCVLRGGPCSVGAVCSMHEPWSRARAAMVAELDRTPVTASEQ